jgi:hypothetical protein
MAWAFWKRQAFFGQMEREVLGIIWLGSGVTGTEGITRVGNYGAVGTTSDLPSSLGPKLARLRCECNRLLSPSILQIAEAGNPEANRCAPKRILLLAPIDFADARAYPR